MFFFSYQPTYEEHNFPIFILVHSIDVGEILGQLIPYTGYLMRITGIKTLLSYSPQILKIRFKQN